MQNDQLLELIRNHIKRASFSRRVHEPDEIVNEIYIRLAENPEMLKSELPVEAKIPLALRRILRENRETMNRFTDIDELDHDDHPSYTVEEFRRGENDQRIFKEFCNAQPLSKRAVYSMSPSHSKTEIARTLGIPIKKVRTMLKEMPGELKIFAQKYLFEKTAD